MCLRRGRDGRAHLAEQSGAFVHVLARAGSQAEMVSADPLLDEAIAGQRRVAGLDADRSPRADAVEEPVAVGHYFHPELGQKPTIELAGNLEAAHRQDHMRHSVNFDRHRGQVLSPRRFTNSTQIPFGRHTASISARARASSMPSTSRRKR